MYTYPEHFYDPFRKGIALGYICHEMRKLFPSIKDTSQWELMDKDLQWLYAQTSETGVRDFWNLTHSISKGYKLKNIVPWVTSLGFSWTKEQLALDQLTFGTNFEELAQFEKQPAVATVKSWYLDPTHKPELDKALQAHTERSTATAPRDHFPIIVTKRGNKLIISDGNRRTLRALLNQEEKIEAYLASPTDKPALYEQWTPTQTLMELVQFHRYQKKLGNTITQETALLIFHMIKESKAGRHEFLHRVLDSTLPEDTALTEAVKNLLTDL